MSNSWWHHGPQLTRLLCPWDFPGKNTGVGCHFLLQGIFPTQDWTCISSVSCTSRRILYHLGSTFNIRIVNKIIYILFGGRAGGEGDDRGWDGCMASPTQWTWVCVDSGSWWWTGRPGMVRFMGLQSRTWLGNWTELNWRLQIQWVYYTYNISQNGPLIF